MFKGKHTCQLLKSHRHFCCVFERKNI